MKNIVYKLICNECYEKRGGNQNHVKHPMGELLCPDFKLSDKCHYCKKKISTPNK